MCNMPTCSFSAGYLFSSLTTYRSAGFFVYYSGIDFTMDYMVKPELLEVFTGEAKRKLVTTKQYCLSCMQLCLSHEVTEAYVL